jgi:hypothetical protein
MPTAWPGQVGTRRQGRASGRWLLLPMIVLAVVAGCAQPGTQPLGTDAADPRAEPATVTVGPDDGGKTVDLKVGDRLVVELQVAKQPSRVWRPWRLEVPRSKVLRRVDGESTPTQVVLTAETPGTVRLLLWQRRSCDPPLQCPMAEPSGQSERMSRPLPAVAITVRVQ